MYNSCQISPKQKTNFKEIFSIIVKQYTTTELVNALKECNTNLIFENLTEVKKVVQNKFVYLEVSPLDIFSDSIEKVPSTIKEFISKCIQETCNQLDKT